MYQLCAVCKTRPAELDENGVWQPCSVDKEHGWLLTQKWFPRRSGEKPNEIDMEC